ncbi:TOBE domain-containing protein [Sorangium sp. So ce1099]|uniref:TOBE domain-containing protein n=1 Tax=Sorangium sp. So ce1099 TaxID=3133331 RepID=UPI003F629C29
MQISGRNKIPGKIKEIVVGDVMAKVVLDGPGGVELVAVITSDAVKELGLQVGQDVQALIKATEIMVTTG